MAGPIPYVEPLGDISYGAVEHVSPLVRRVVADNASKYTYKGTGTYIVGHGDVAVIDPGPALDSHRDALAHALDGERVRAILVTHTHGDHSPLAEWLKSWSGAPTYAYGPHGAVAEEDPADDPWADDPDHAPPTDHEATKGESLDVAFRPDVVVRTGSSVNGPGWSFEAIHTPGHTSNHVCWALGDERTLFSGDHVMGWSTAVISPPDGDMRAYCRSLSALIERGDQDLVYRPTHGGPIFEPVAFVEAYLDHRLAREAAVIDQLALGPRTIKEIVEVLYADVRRELHRAAGRSVLSHLFKLTADGMVSADTASPTLRSTYRLA